MYTFLHFKLYSQLYDNLSLIQAENSRLNFVSPHIYNNHIQYDCSYFCYVDHNLVNVSYTCTPSKSMHLSHVNSMLCSLFLFTFTMYAVTTRMSADKNIRRSKVINIDVIHYNRGAFKT
jgi:hypothetical protein